MAVYAIGDLQGCYDELLRLLDLVDFEPASDQLWFTGDLVNRGPKSLECLRFVRELGDGAVTVLGNHDLHLLAIALQRAESRPSDTVQPILDAPDCDDLLNWLRARPLLHHDDTLGYTLIHAGLLPQWDLAQARQYAHEVEKALRGDRYKKFFAQMYGNQPDRWSDTLNGWDRLRVIINCFTRMRYCDARGRMHLNAKGSPGSQPEGSRPWFEHPHRETRNLRIVFGHWSTLGPRDDQGIFPLDTGCLWGGQLTAMRLDETHKRFSIQCPGAQKPDR